MNIKWKRVNAEVNFNILAVSPNKAAFYIKSFNKGVRRSDNLLAVLRIIRCNILEIIFNLVEETVLSLSGEVQ